MSAHARRVLLVTRGETDTLPEQLHERVVRTRADVLVVAPAVNSSLRHWVSDTDSARRQAEDRVVRCVEHLRLAGFEAEGMIGDPDPALAIDDALAVFDADVVVVDDEFTDRAGHRSGFHIVPLSDAA